MVRHRFTPQCGLKVQWLSVQSVQFAAIRLSVVYPLHAQESFLLLGVCFCSRSPVACCMSLSLRLFHADPSSKTASAPLFITHSDGGLHSKAVSGKAHLLCRINKMFIHFMKLASCVVSPCIRLQNPISAREREREREHSSAGSSTSANRFNLKRRKTNLFLFSTNPRTSLCIQQPPSLSASFGVFYSRPDGKKRATKVFSGPFHPLCVRLAMQQPGGPSIETFHNNIFYCPVLSERT